MIPIRRSIVPIAVQAGQVISLDVDFGSSNNINTFDTELWLVDAFGNILASNNNSASDLGSTGTLDPKLQYTAASAGLLFVVVTQKDNNYLDGQYDFDNLGTDTGVFQLNIGIAGLSALATGTNGDDNLTLLASQRRFDALDGDDQISGALARNSIEGGEGNDALIGNEKVDILSGGTGNDTAYGYGDADILIGGRGTDSLYGGDDEDQVLGGFGNDYLYGNNGRDILAGEEGNDYLYGGAGHDKIYGGEGDNSFYGEDGNDKLDGGSGVRHLLLLQWSRGSFRRPPHRNSARYRRLWLGYADRIRECLPAQTATTIRSQAILLITRWSARVVTTRWRD